MDTTQFCADYDGKQIALANDDSSTLIAVRMGDDVAPGTDADDNLWTVTCATVAGEDYLSLERDDGGLMTAQASTGGHMPIIITDGPPDMGEELWQVTETGAGSYTFEQPSGRVLAEDGGDVTTGPATATRASWTVADAISDTTASFCASYDGDILEFTSGANRGLAGLPSSGGYHVESILGLSGVAGQWVLDCASDSSSVRLWNMQSDGALIVDATGVFADPSDDADVDDARFTVRSHSDGTLSLANVGGAGTLDVAGILVVAGTASISSSQRWTVSVN